MENSPLALFEHEKFGSLRVVRSDQGAQWFVAKDVCGCLGLDTSNLSKMLDEDELSTYPVQYTDRSGIFPLYPNRACIPSSCVPASPKPRRSSGG